MDTTIWTGASGSKYTYTVFGPSSQWNDLPGNYIFASIVGGRWMAHYVGQASSFKNRFSNHEKWEDAVKSGATHVHAHVNNSGESARLAEEYDLIRSNQPPCNVQLKSA